MGAAVLAGSAALAHHSFAMFDTDNQVRFEGVVAEVQWTNPHAWMEVDSTDLNGEPVRWSVEFNSPNNLSRQGWKRSTLQTGDPVVFAVSPLRDGRPAGLFYAVRLPDGSIMRDPRTPAEFEPEAAPLAGSIELNPGEEMAEADTTPSSE